MPCMVLSRATTVTVGLEPRRSGEDRHHQIGQVPSGRSWWRSVTAGPAAESHEAV